MGKVLGDFIPVTTSARYQYLCKDKPYSPVYLFILTVSVISMLSFPVRAQTGQLSADSSETGSPPVKDNTQPVDAVPGNEASWLDITEDYLANTVHDFSVYIDHGLAKEEEEEAITNRSYIRFRSQAGYSHLDDFTSDGKVSVRVDLPHVEHNWHLVFETDSDDYDSLENKQRDIAGTSDSASNPVGGIEYRNGLLPHWDTHFGIGMKLQLPLDPFARTEIRRVGVFDNEWVSQFSQQVFYYHTRGAGLLSELKFYYPMTEDRSQIFTIGSSAQYMLEDEQWELLLQSGVSDRINRDHLMDYSAGMSIAPGESDKVTNYWISATWQQNIHKNWLYLSIIPIVESPRKYDYRLNPGIQLKLELFFSKNRSINRLNRSIPESTRKNVNH